jgi:predicted phosphodiesterase
MSTRGTHRPQFTSRPHAGARILDVDITPDRHEDYHVILALPDMHVPNHDRESLSSVMRYAEDLKPDTIVQLGDFCDWEAISRHRKSKYRDYKLLSTEIEEGKAVMSSLSSLCSQVYYIEGNHEAWTEIYMDEHPELDGMLSPESLLGLRDIGVHYVPFWTQGEVLRAGKAHFGHGLSLAANHPLACLRAYDVNFFYGHTHDIASASGKKLGNDDTIVAQSLGTLSRYDLSYMRGTPNKWQQGFGVFYIRPSGYFFYYVVRVINHSFIAPNGKIYTP